MQKNKLWTHKEGQDSLTKTVSSIQEEGGSIIQIVPLFYSIGTYTQKLDQALIIYKKD